MPAKPYSDEELEGFDMRYGPEHIIARFKATIDADRKRFEQTLKGYTDDWGNQKRNFQKRIAELKAENRRLRDRMIEAKQIIEKAHGKPNKDACCETCYILEQLDEWIKALRPKEEVR